MIECSNSYTVRSPFRREKNNKPEICTGNTITRRTIIQNTQSLYTIRIRVCAQYNCSLVFFVFSKISPSCFGRQFSYCIVPVSFTDSMR